MLGRKRIICQNATKNRMRQNVVFVLLIFLSIGSYILDNYWLKTEKGFPRFMLLVSIFIWGLILWVRYRRIEILGVCGIARWFGTHKFYVEDSQIIYLNRFTFLRETEFYIYLKSCRKYIFHVTETDENIAQLKDAITRTNKGYVMEPIVEKKYKRHIFNLFYKNYEIKKLHKYGEKIENAELVGGMDLVFGTVIPVYEFKDKQGKHMIWGVYRIKEKEIKQKLHKKCTIYYAPGKAECVLEKEE